MNILNRNLCLTGIVILSLFSFIFSNCPEGTEVCLSLDSSSLNMDNSVAVGGYQFNHDGCASSASGGDLSNAAGFVVSGSETTVLAFSFSGGTIPAGSSGSLLNLGSAECTEESLSNFVFSDPDGIALSVAWSEVASGCTDETACNYDSEAVEDDGSCWFIGVDNDYCDCDMNMLDCLGECGGSAMEDCAGECNGSAMEDCLGECGGSALEDVCGECGGTEEDPTQCIQEGYSLDISNVDPDAGTLDILMNNENPIAGFQFNVTGVNLTGASGGSSADAGFAVSTNASSGVVLGFSFSGSVIPPNNGVLVTLSFDSLGESVCLSDVILSDSAGEAVDVLVGDCFEGFGCTDVSACNYDIDAVIDDGSCAYEEDCLGECGGSAVIDCAGECDGDAVEDCAGECNGDALVDCFGVCDGGAVEDCAGECGGTAEEDVCGVCDGGEINIDNCWDSNELWIHSFDQTSETTGTLNLYMSNLEPVAGFEFRVTSTVDSFGLGSASGGSASDSGFEVSTSSSGMVLGFSFTGATINSGYGLLSSIDISFDSTDDMYGYIYLSEVVIADGAGVQMEFGVQDYFAIGGAPDIPMAPENLVASVIELTNIDLGWDASSDADFYTVYRNGSAIADVNTPGYFDQDLSCGTTYEYVVTASNGAGESSASASASATTDAPAIPDVPTNLTAEVVEINNVDLGWNASDGADSYRVFRNGFPVATVSAPGYFDQDLETGTTYEYTVNASNCGGQSDESESVTITTGFEATPPSNLEATAADEQITLTWQEPMGSQESVDCAGTAFDPYDAVYSNYDCLVCGLEGCGADLGDSCVDWLGDGFCDDGSFGFVFDCEDFGCDCGDCGFDCDDPYGHCGEPVPCTEITNFQVSGLVDIDGDGIEDPCYDATDGTSSHYFQLSWEGDCPVTDIYWGVDSPFENGGAFGVFQGPTLLFYGFEANEGPYQFMVTNSNQDPPVESDIAIAETGPEDCTGGVMSDEGFSGYNRVSNNYTYSPNPTSKLTGELADYSGNSNTNTREEITNYNIYMGTISGDYSLITTTSGSTYSYTVTGLENGTEYFFVATATYDPGQLESGYSNEASATPIPFQAPIPENLVAEPGDSEIHLSWDLLDIPLGPGDDCEVIPGVSGIVDCSGVCFQVDYFVDGGFIGDGTCHDADFGVDLICEEFGCDCGDCGIECADPNGYCDGLMGNTSNSEQRDREEDFVGYNVYRSTTSGSGYELLTSIEGNEGEYTDSGLTNGVMYYYVVTSQYDETESAYSNEVGASPMDFVNITLGDIAPGIYDPGDEFTVVVSMDNPTDVAGIQIVLQDTPESVSMVNVDGLGRLEGQDLNSFSADFNGQATILWFSLTGDVLPAGSGEIIEVTYQVNDSVDGGQCEISLNTSEEGTALSDSAGNAFFYSSNSTFVDVAYEANLSLVQTSDTTFDVVLINTVDVSGFQMTITDDPDNYTFSSVQGTSVISNFLVNGSENDGMVLLGFSLTGDIVPPGNEVIMNVTVTPNNSGDFETELCFDNIVLSDPLAQPILAGSQCATFVNPFIDGLSNEDIALPEEFSIGNAYPNPFNPSTTFEWSMKYADNHRIDVYNTNGQLLEVISQGYANPGYYQTTWDARNYSSGIYIVRFIVGSDVIGTRKVMLVK